MTRQQRDFGLRMQGEGFDVLARKGGDAICRRGGKREESGLMRPELDEMPGILAGHDGRVECAVCDVGGELLPVLEGEFWTAKQRDGHSLQEISYRACYKPQLPAFFISRFCEKGDGVYDPFAGRGMTLIEAQLHGCRAIGNDINPLTRILAAPRLDPPTVEMVASRLREVHLPESQRERRTQTCWFSLSDRRWVSLMGGASIFVRGRGQVDLIEWMRGFRWLPATALRATRKFFPFTRCRPTRRPQCRFRGKSEKRNQSPEYRDTKAIILKKTKSLLRDGVPPCYARDDFEVFCDAADSTPGIRDESVKLVVTSSPFLDTVD